MMDPTLSWKFWCEFPLRPPKKNNSASKVLDSNKTLLGTNISPPRRYFWTDDLRAETRLVGPMWSTVPWSCAMGSFQPSNGDPFCPHHPWDLDQYFCVHWARPNLWFADLKGGKKRMSPLAKKQRHPKHHMWCGWILEKKHHWYFW